MTHVYTPAQWKGSLKTADAVREDVLCQEVIYSRLG